MAEDRVSRIRTLLREARRRRVYTATVAYVALAVVLMQTGPSIFEALNLPAESNRVLTVLLLLGLPVVLVLAWIFDVGPEGVSRTEALAAPPPHSSPAPGTAAPAPASPAAGAHGTLAPPANRAGSALPTARSVRVVGGRAAARSSALAPDRGHAPAAGPPADAPAAPPDPERLRTAALSHVRHELRTPINAILGYSEMLIEDASEAGDDEARADLRRIHTAGRELLTLVDTILDPARVAAEADRELASYSAQIRADLRNPVNAVVGYAELLLETDRPAMAADLERIRTAAGRLLEMSADIVRLATAASLTPGSPAAAVLPAASALEGVLAKIRPVEHEAAAERQGSLLVVDDNAFNRDVLARQLARRGYLVATAENGREALDRLDSDDFDLVLLDIIMPEIDGVEVLRHIRADARLAALPVIMISSLDEIDSAIRCLELGATDYLTKPFHPAILDARIGAALDLLRLRQQAAPSVDQVLAGSPLARLALAACPRAIGERIVAGETRILESYPAVTVLCCDLEHALRGGGRSDPAVRADHAEALCRTIESVAHAHGADTVLVHGSTVLLVAGTHDADDAHTERAALIALDVLDTLRDTADTAPGIRFGLHTGAAFGALLEAERLAFHLWGEAVELARALEQHAEVGTIHASPAVHAKLRGRFEFTSRGVLDVAGKGQMRTWRLSGAAPALAGG